MPYTTPAPTILSVELIDGRLEVVKRVEALTPQYGQSVIATPKVWKEVYGAKICPVGKSRPLGDVRLEIILLKTIPATYKSAQPESWVFEE